MRSIKILGLTIVAALSLVCLGGSTASATVLCETNTDPCTGEGYGAGAIIEASSSNVDFAVPFGTVTCTGSTLKAEVGNPGGESGEAVTGPFTSITFTSCSCPVTSLNKGTFEVNSSESGNGTLKGTGNELEIKCSGISCIYKTSSTTLGVVTGGESAVLDVSATVPRTGGSGGIFCGSTGTFTASYVVSAPEALFMPPAILIPTVVARPVGGGKDLMFKAGEKVKELEIENTGEVLNARLTEQSTDPEPGGFKIIGGGTCAIPGTVLGPTKKCTVKIEFVGKAGDKATYTVKYGNKVRPKAKTAELGIEA